MWRARQRLDGRGGGAVDRAVHLAVVVPDPDQVGIAGNHGDGADVINAGDGAIIFNGTVGNTSGIAEIVLIKYFIRKGF